jgi:hypothetical protein
MVRYYIKIGNCLGFNHEHIIEVTPIDVIIKGEEEAKKEASKKDETPQKEEENPFDKNKFYTTVYDCRSKGKTVLATFKGDQVYRDDNPPDPLPVVTDVRELTEGDDLDWLTHHREQQQGLSAHFIQKAEGYQNLWTAVFTIYTGVLVLFGFMEAGGSTLTQLEWYLKALFLLPILAWIAGIYFFFKVFEPTVGKMTPNSPAEIRENYTTANVAKANNYRRGIACFSVGILFIAVALIGGIFFTSHSDTPGENVIFIIKDEFVEKVQEIPISMIPETNMTTVVQLYNTTESGYRIGLEGGTIVELDKNWVTNIIRVSNTTEQGSQAA